MLAPLQSVQIKHAISRSPSTSAQFRFKGEEADQAPAKKNQSRGKLLVQKLKGWAQKTKTALGNLFFSEMMMNEREKSIVQLMDQFQSNLEKKEVRFSIPEAQPKNKTLDVDLSIREKPYRLKVMKGKAYLLEQRQGPVCFAWTMKGKVLLYRNRNSSFEIQSSNRFVIKRARQLFKCYQEAFEVASREAKMPSDGKPAEKGTV